MPRLKGEEAKQLVDNGAVLLDVRTPGEFSGTHLPGALNVPVQELEARVGELDPKRVTVVYCRSGMRSSSAAKILAAKGFAEVHDLGPMGAWDGKGAGLSTVLIPLVVSLTLGLAPFTPEPHVIGKLRWVAGGAEGMGLMDWGDLLMHGAPWVWLLFAVLSVIRSRT